MKNVLQLLFADPDLVTRDLVNGVLAYKRLDGVDEALRTVADRVFPGRRQAKVLDLSGSDVPILAVWGSEDAIVPASHADNLPDHARVDIIDGKGHSVHMEAAGMVNRLVADFLRSAES
jgi:pyruvate dehydrogenase E2 component (dihydrolipoamide acetyltransferase)